MFHDLVREVPDYQVLPDLDTIERHTRVLAAQGLPGVQVRRVGASREGRPIDMISLGSGPRNALLVGTPHPNEAIGCLTIAFLIDAFRRDPGLLDETGYTWHFIMSIEPDGLERNRSWLGRPHEVQAYLEGFFRPALCEQAEYAFPLRMDGLDFDRSTPENEAWQTAIRLARPDFMYSLHNSEVGGVFHILSHPFMALAERLSEQAADAAVPLDTLGELGAELLPLTPGVFQHVDIAAMLQGAGEQERRALWPAGQSSFGYTAPATFCLTVEVPHWRVAGDGHGVTELRDALAPAAAWARDASALLDRHLPAFERDGVDSAGRPYLEALRDARAMAVRQLAFLSNPPAMRLPIRDAMAQRWAMRLFTLRPVAMLRILAMSDPGYGRVRQEAGEYLYAALADPALCAALVPVPLQTSVRIQVRAGLTAAAMLKERAHLGQS